MSFLSLSAQWNQAVPAVPAGFPPASAFPLSADLTQAAAIFAATASSQAAMTASAPSGFGAAELSAHSDMAPKLKPASSGVPLSDLSNIKPGAGPVPLGDLSNVLNGSRQAASEKA